MSSWVPLRQVAPGAPLPPPCESSIRPIASCHASGCPSSLTELVAGDAHAGGEPGRVIVGSIADVPGATMFDKMAHLCAYHDDLRQRMLREPRGYPAANCNQLLPATDPAAAAGFVIMEQVEYPPMSGSNTICVATVLVEMGMVAPWTARPAGRRRAPGWQCCMPAAPFRSAAPSATRGSWAPCSPAAWWPRRRSATIPLWSPTITGRAWVTGHARYVLDPDDPFPVGFTVGDIWGTTAMLG